MKTMAYVLPIFLLAPLGLASPARAQCLSQKLTVDGVSHFAQLGRSIAVAGETAVFGAYRDAVVALQSGSAHVFQHTSAGWQAMERLVPSDGHQGQQFGENVSISDRAIFVGAMYDYTFGNWYGAVYVFEPGPSGWTQVAKLYASDGAPYDRFGADVAVSGQHAIVGQYGDHWGAVYFFERIAGTWTEVQKLVPNDLELNEGFAVSVAISGDRAIAGAQHGTDDGILSGTAYVYERGAAGWAQVDKLTAYDREEADGFGAAVAIDGDRAVVGAARNDDACPWNINCDSGSAYVFERIGGAWLETAKLLPDDLAPWQMFGTSVALAGPRIAVGSYAAHDDCPPEDPSCASGTAYLFELVSGGWQQATELVRPDADPGDFYGFATALSNEFVLVSSIGDDDGCPGSLCNFGAVYVFPLESSTAYCEAKTNSLGCVPVISSSGTPTIGGGDPFAVRANQVLAQKTGFLFWGREGRDVPLFGGRLCVGPPIVRTPAQSSGGSPAGGDCSGAYSFHFSPAYLSAHSLGPGASVYAQFWSRDPGFAPPDNVGLTGGLRFTMCW